MPSPIPPFPPVTTATLPLRSNTLAPPPGRLTAREAPPAPVYADYAPPIPQGCRSSTRALAAACERGAISRKAAAFAAPDVPGGWGARSRRLGGHGGPVRGPP